MSLQEMRQIQLFWRVDFMILWQQKLCILSWESILQLNVFQNTVQLIWKVIVVYRHSYLSHFAACLEFQHVGSQVYMQRSIIQDAMTGHNSM